MKHQFKIILARAYLFSACQTNSTFDQFDSNAVDLTRITGEPITPQSFFDSALWSMALGAALLATLSSSGSNYKATGMDTNELDSEWIE